MQIVEMKVGEIAPYEKNPRKNDDAVEYVANSIKEFGFKVPIVIDKDKKIVAGHTRWKAAKKLRLKTVPCVIADDLTEEQIKAFRLADNKVTELAGWDFALLDDELAEIGLNMEQFGFMDFGADDVNSFFTDAAAGADAKTQEAHEAVCPHCGGEITISHDYNVAAKE